MKKEIIFTKDAPAPGNYSQAIKYGNLIWVSGQTSDDLETGEPIHDSVANQTERIMNNIKTILEAAGSSMEQVIKCNVYLSSIDIKPEFVNVYKTFFPENPPARIVTTAKGLDAGLDVEIDVVAGCE